MRVVSVCVVLCQSQKIKCQCSKCMACIDKQKKLENIAIQKFRVLCIPSMHQGLICPCPSVLGIIVSTMCPD
jgi:hypothetical protein